MNVQKKNQGKTTDQAKALIQEASARVVQQASEAGTPIVMEQLDFQKKKAELESELHKELRAKRARRLSSFAYGNMIQALKSAAFRSGVEVMEVNPAYTLVMGAMNWATPKGMTPHQADALAIARRGWVFSENPSVRTAKVARGATHVTLIYRCGIGRSLCGYFGRLVEENSKRCAKHLFRPEQIRPISTVYCSKLRNSPVKSRTQHQIRFGVR